MTIYDIARIAGVSASTVSRVLNGRPGISAETRDRILSITQASGFELSEAARGLAKRSSMLIGILVSDIRNQHYTNGAYVMVEEFQKKGYCSIILNTGSDDESRVNAVRMLSSRRVDGAVLIGSSFSSEVMASAISTYMPSTPIVMENGMLSLDNVYSVIADDEGGLRAAVDYLYDRGRRRFCYVNANDTPSNRMKREGVGKAIASHGLECRFLECEDSFEGGYEATRRILDGGRADAILYSMDILAAGGVRALSDHGVSVPDEIAVFGVDNSIYSVISRPSISSVDTNLSRMSSQCVRTLEDAMAGRPAERMTELPYELVIRESTP